MVLFDVADCFSNAVHCAIAMNTVAHHIINKHFKADEVRFGIGIDYGRMLVTKAGIRKHGSKQVSYRNLVWLGRPANVASKLTDAANKKAEYETVEKVSVAYKRTEPALFSAMLGSPMSMGALLGLSTSPYGILNTTGSSNVTWDWATETLPSFVSSLKIGLDDRLTHQNPNFQYVLPVTESVMSKPATPPILMTKAVWNWFKQARPNGSSVQHALFKKANVQVPGYSDVIFGGHVEYPQFRA